MQMNNVDLLKNVLERSINKNVSNSPHVNGKSYS